MRLFIIVICGLTIAACSKNQSGNSSRNENELTGVGRLYNGKKIDLWKYYDKNGDTLRVEFYKPNLELGFIKHFNNNQITLREDFYEGKLSMKTAYFDNGEIRHRTGYRDTLLHGHQIMYFENGQIKIKAQYDNGTPIGEFSQYYQNGNLEFYSKDIRNSYGFIYDSIGTLMDSVRSPF